MVFCASLVDPYGGFVRPKFHWWFFCAFFWLFANLARCENSLCETILSGGLQALTLDGSTLYFGVQNRLYSIPLNESYFDPDLPRLALYDRSPELAPGYQAYGLWTNVSWLKYVVAGDHSTSSLSLDVLNIFPMPTPHLHVAYQDGDASGPIHKIINLLTGEVEVTKKSLEAPYSLWTDGISVSYLVRKEQGGHTMIERNPSVHSVGQATLYLNEPEDGYIEFSDMPEENPVTVTLPAFGFIHKKTIHIWDLANKRLLFFKDPTATPGSSQEVTAVPLSQYLVCSKWMDEKGKLSWRSFLSGGGGTIAMVIGVLVTLVGLFCCVLVTQRNKNNKNAKRKRNRTHKSPSSNAPTRQTAHTRLPSTASPPKSSSKKSSQKVKSACNANSEDMLEKCISLLNELKMWVYMVEKYLEIKQVESMALKLRETFQMLNDVKNFVKSRQYDELLHDYAIVKGQFCAQLEATKAKLGRESGAAAPKLVSGSTMPKQTAGKGTTRVSPTPASLSVKPSPSNSSRISGSDYNSSSQDEIPPSASLTSAWINKILSSLEEDA